MLAAIALVPAAAQESAAVTRGAAWLQSQIGANGALFSEATSVATPMQARSETHTTLRLRSFATPALGAIIADEPDDVTEYLARKILSLPPALATASASLIELTTRQNADGGFGGARGFASNPLDTAWVLLALNQSKNGPTALSGAAVNYLLATQQADGAFGMAPDAPNAYITSIVALALQANGNNTAALNALNRVNAWLLAHQGADGSWGSVAETSAVYLALIGSVSDAALQTTVKSYLLSQQALNGDWGADPYATALALRALAAKAQPVVTTGRVVMRVVDGATGHAVAGAMAQLQGTAIAPSLSDATGQLSFSEVPAGNYIGLLTGGGYAPRSVPFAVRAGTTTDLGSIALTVAPTSGMLKGVVRDKANNTLLRDVVISVTGSANASTHTLADGSYALTGLAPGPVTIVAAKPGFASVTASGTVVAGETLMFSPTLSLPGEPADTAGTLIGQAVDQTSLAPLPGVTISVGATGKTAMSGQDGRFSVTNVPAGTYAVSFSKPGYTSKLFATVLVAPGSTNDFQVLGFSKTLTTVALAGRLSDIQSGKAIAQATVTVLGAALTTQTDSNGDYRIEGLAPGGTTLRFSASGYASETVAASFPAAGEYRFDKTLALDGAGNPSFSMLVSDQPVYPAHAPAVLKMEIANTAATPVENAVIDITIFDPQGQVIGMQQAVRIDADGVAQENFMLAPNSTTAVDVKWSTLAHAPGVYQFKARIFTSNASTGGKTVLAERTSSFTIAASRKVLRLSIVPVPAYSVFEATEQMQFKVEAIHQSNQPVTIPFRYAFMAPGGAVLKEEEGSITLQPNDMLGSVTLGAFVHRFTAAGVYPVVLSATEDPAPQVIANGEVQVAPGIRVGVTQKITPTSVTPDGDKRIRIHLELKGVEQK